MAKLIIHKNRQCICVTRQLNMLYRLAGLFVLTGSIYILLYPVITGEILTYRGQLDLQLISIPGLFLSLLAFWTDKFIVQKDLDIIKVLYGLPFLAFYKKTYKLSLFTKILLIVDAKGPDMIITGVSPQFVKPWYHVTIISNETEPGTELVIAKSLNPDESKNIAEDISAYTRIQLETGPHYPVKP